MENFDYNGIFSSLTNLNGDQSIGFIDNKTFNIISEIEPKHRIDIISVPCNESQNKSETNDTSKENEIIDIIHERKEIEMICPFVKRKLFKKSLRFRRKKLLAKIR